MRERELHSLRLVTSSYHIPRTMIALAWQMPEVELIPFPVIARRNHGNPGWASIPVRLLASEYLKYITVLVRTRIGEAPRAAMAAARDFC